MVDPREFLKPAQHLHGHKCPAMPLGLRAGAAAMNALAVPRSRDRELQAVIELGEDHCSHCFADGVQMITGCTLGKENIRTVAYGKFGLTLADRESGRAVRVVPRAQAQLAMKQTRFYQEYKLKGVPASKVPDEMLEPLVQQVMSAPLEQLLSVAAPFRMESGRKAETLAAQACDACGELVVEKYLRVLGDRKVCIPCQEKALQPAPGRNT